MGQRAKWLQDERYIRIAGALLMVSPIFNYLTSVAFNSNLTDKWNSKQLIAGFMIASGLAWLGRISNFLVGFLMFRGKSSAWVPVLAILGFTIAKNLITFKHDFQVNHVQTIMGLLINVALFLLVFESEYRLNKELNKKLKAARERRQSPIPATTVPSKSKETTKTAVMKVAEPEKKMTSNIPAAKAPNKSQQASSAKPRGRSFIVTKGMPIEFEGWGRFAEVIHCTDSELWVKPTNHLPTDLHKKVLTLQAPKQKALIRLRFSTLREDSTLVFRVIA